MKTLASCLAAFVLVWAGPLCADYAVTPRGEWPDTWPRELDSLRGQSRTLEGPLAPLLHYAIPFTDRESFEAAWPHIVSVKSPGAPIVLRRGPSFWLDEGATAGVCIHTPPRGEAPLADADQVRGNWIKAIYIELIVDGDIVDLNRIPLPPDTPIVDERFKEAASKADDGAGIRREPAEPDGSREDATDESIAISTSSRGQWQLAGGIRLDIHQRVFHGADVVSTGTLTWPTRDDGSTPSYELSLACDAFANREPWLLVWQPGASSMWLVQGPLQSPTEYRRVVPQVESLMRIDFGDPERIARTVWHYDPGNVPASVAAEIWKKFRPPRAKHPGADPAKPPVYIGRAEDTRPVTDLLQGSWSTADDAALQVQLKFPDVAAEPVVLTAAEVGSSGTKTIEARLRIKSEPAKNAMRLLLDHRRSDGSVNTISLGWVTRGIGDRLLLDVWGNSELSGFPAQNDIELIVRQQ